MPTSGENQIWSLACIFQQLFASSKLLILLNLKAILKSGSAQSSKHLSYATNREKDFNGSLSYCILFVNDEKFRSQQII